ncbi:MAG: hypothetical protein AB8H86_00725 [Polyangiales bacterium]
MESGTLKNALARLVSKNALALQGDEYGSVEGHRLSFYLGRPGQAMVLGPIESVELADDLVILTRTSDSSTLLIAYDAVHGVASTPVEAKSERRTGFS